MNDEGLTWRHAAITAGVVGLLSYAGLRFWTSSGRTAPQNSWFAVAVILLMAAAILVAAHEIRRYVQGKSTIMPTPQRGRRTLVGSQATTIGGGAAAGWYAAQVFLHIPNSDVDSIRSALFLALALTAASAGLAAAGLVAQAWCRIPPEDEDRKPGRDTYPPATA